MVELLRADLRHIKGLRLRWEERVDGPRRFSKKLFEFVRMDAFSCWSLRRFGAGYRRKRGHGRASAIVVRRLGDAP